MKRANVGRKGAASGFTLVELLLVMGIIVMLVGLLFPAVNAAVTAVRIAATQNTINNLSAGLEAFKVDWGVYPPSSSGKDGWPPSSWGGPSDGYYALAYYLMGANGMGWGSLYNNLGPFGGTATAAYSPYFKITVLPSPNASPDPVQDAFKPGKVIFYYRYDPAENPPYTIAGNRGSGILGDTSSANFLSQAGLELLARPLDAATNTKRWLRQDYLLISAGADRYWGYVMETGSGSATRVVQTENVADVGSGVAMCDDICNFKH
jgi:type II secretory pathway pseudopilin PulG